jgi:hypothetical protein
MVHDPEVRRVLDALLNRDHLQVRQMSCPAGRKATVVRLDAPPWAVLVHGCDCEIRKLIDQAIRENKWESYP